MGKQWYWVLGYVLAGIVFGIGCFMWQRANAYIPPEPELAPLNSFTFAKEKSFQPLEYYSSLQRGDLFFGKVPFHTDLKLYGVTRGKNSRAVVGIAGKEQTWIVKPGSVIEDEIIVCATYLIPDI